MTRTPSPERKETTRSPSRTGMRLIVPLQGVVQGRGGLILGSLIPCALFYFLQFYLKRHRSPPSNPPSRSPSAANLSELPRSSSRASLLTRGSTGRASPSARAASIAKPNDSPYYIGLDRARDDPYDEIANPDGIIQLGLSENRVIIHDLPLSLFCLFVVLDWTALLTQAQFCSYCFEVVVGFNWRVAFTKFCQLKFWSSESGYGAQRNRNIPADGWIDGVQSGNEDIVWFIIFTSSIDNNVNNRCLHKIWREKKEK